MRLPFDDMTKLSLAYLSLPAAQAAYIRHGHGRSGHQHGGHHVDDFITLQKGNQCVGATTDASGNFHALLVDCQAGHADQHWHRLGQKLQHKTHGCLGSEATIIGATVTLFGCDHPFALDFTKSDSGGFSTGNGALCLECAGIGLSLQACTPIAPIVTVSLGSPTTSMQTPLSSSCLGSTSASTSFSAISGQASTSHSDSTSLSNGMQNSTVSQTSSSSLTLPSPSNMPATSPPMSASATPSTGSVVVPASSATFSPASSSTMSPTSSATMSPASSATMSPASDSTLSPTSSLAANSTSSPITSPTTSPTSGPTISLTPSPSESPTLIPTSSLATNQSTTSGGSTTLSLNTVSLINAVVVRSRPAVASKAAASNSAMTTPIQPTATALYNPKCPGLGDWPRSSALFEAEVLKLINFQRSQPTKCGSQVMPPVAALVADDAITCVSRAFAQDMSTYNYFGNIDRSGNNPFTRLTNAGVSWTAAAENIAENEISPRQVVRGWVGSPERCAEVMGNYTKTGVGFAHNYWVQSFTAP